MDKQLLEKELTERDFDYEKGHYELSEMKEDTGAMPTPEEFTWDDLPDTLNPYRVKVHDSKGNHVFTFDSLKRELRKAQGKTAR